jgi:hypothetical protein
MPLRPKLPAKLLLFFIPACQHLSFTPVVYAAICQKRGGMLFAEKKGKKCKPCRRCSKE